MEFISGIEHDTLYFDCMSSEDKVPLDMIYDSTIYDDVNFWDFLGQLII